MHYDRFVTREYGTIPTFFIESAKQNKWIKQTILEILDDKKEI